MTRGRSGNVIERRTDEVVLQELQQDKGEAEEYHGAQQISIHTVGLGGEFNDVEECAKQNPLFARGGSEANA